MGAGQGEDRYVPQKLPRREDLPGREPLPKTRETPSDPTETFYEIDYDAGPMAGVGKFVRKPQKITAQRDPVRERFRAMRDIARKYPLPFVSASRFFDPAVQLGNARVFYEQARFMEDFEDDFPGSVSFSAYYPTYQIMSYEQLRTYFTFRTRVRRGTVEPVGVSYAFLYVYELLENIGAAGPGDALLRLLDFWDRYREYDDGLDRYLKRWLREYPVYYPLSPEEEAPLRARGLTAPGGARDFAFYRGLSGYDPLASRFCTPENESLLTGGVTAALSAAEAAFSAAGAQLDDILFCPATKAPRWVPFRGAVFYPWRRDGDRTVLTASGEVYLCREGRWTHGATVATRRGKQLLAYIMKKAEAVLRGLTRYRYALKAETSLLGPETAVFLLARGIDLPGAVESGVRRFYREATRTVVTVRAEALTRIREDALATQDALTVEEPEEDLPVFPTEPPAPEPAPEPPRADDPWAALSAALTSAEREALRALLNGESFFAAATRLGEMPEPLAEGINEKAMEQLGDGLLDEALALYPDYEDQVKGMVG